MFVSSGLAELNIPIDLILHHASLLLFILGGILFIAVCHLRGRLCSSRLYKLAVSFG